MLEVTPRLIFALLFITGLSLFLYWDRKNVERQAILFYRRTDKGLELIDRIASKFPRFWKVYGAAGVVTGILSVLLITILTGYMFFDMGVNQSTEGGPALILPGLESPEPGAPIDFQPGATFIPIEYWVIAIAVLMFVHELSHGIVARTEGFEINSVGWIILGIIPGAFVEPKGENMLPGDDNDVSESNTIWEGGDWKSRLKVLCAGSFANYLTAGIFLLLMAGTAFGVSSYATQDTSNLNYQAFESYPAFEAGMTEGEIYSINGVDVETVEDVREVLADVAPGEEVILITSEGEFTVETTEMEGFDNGYLGIGFSNVEWKESWQPFQPGLQWFTSLLYVVAIINLFVGLFNMLPFKPLDGGLTVETLITEFWGEEKVSYLNTFSLIGWALILGSVLVGLIGF